KVVQATMGAISRVRVHYCDLPGLFGTLKDVPVFGTFLDGDSIYEEKLGSNGFIVMGNEGKGISPEVEKYVDKRLLIPSYPVGVVTSESLNVGMATAIVVSEFRRRMI
ncbi:MAG TPA: RNA methyltransferase, partial [Candidatus Limisoma gallistercoris]|nr:RNA methyltransferase [Candidatus Limisoma gallistercoris]